MIITSRGCFSRPRVLRSTSPQASGSSERPSSGRLDPQTIPSHQKKSGGLPWCRDLFEDEASFWLDGTLHQTWSRIGVQPRVDTYGLRKTAHVFGAVELSEASFTYAFAEVFNGRTFHQFLIHLVKRYSPRKIFLIIDNGPCHRLDEEGQAWLWKNRRRIELHRLPPYSPEYMPQEGVWKTTRKLTTHNRFYPTIEARNAALRRTFQRFQRTPALIDAHVARFRGRKGFALSTTTFARGERE